MTRGDWMCGQCDDGTLTLWFAPRENEKLFTDSERAQKWRLSLASLLFFTVLLSDHLWFCAEATLTRTRDRERGSPVLSPSMADPFPSPEGPSLSPPLQSAPKGKGKKAPVLGNSTKPRDRPETCSPPGPPGQCAESVCSDLGEGTRNNRTHSPLPFCDSYTLWDLFFGFSNPDTYNCSGDVVQSGDLEGCRRCVETYQRFDQEAQDKYQEFEVLLQKYLQSDEYSVKSCSEDCKEGQRPKHFFKNLRYIIGNNTQSE
ncbi:hypothetical protein GDO86_004038 [Hymenochirus boettgeri]|uniref:Transmembrane protein FAM155A n=1 Tax=Hymenochirus boettgeri TaxID=247094 RepID=A0A8T2K7C5_9PIPI|nr:hypothetical protein GDO86_004038 [Hymenochirus boettgeri]